MVILAAAISKAYAMHGYLAHYWFYQQGLDAK